MSGITGFIDHTGSITEADFNRSISSLKHIGGDGEGVLFEEREHFTFGLANQRLPTIDLNPNAAQPLTSACGKYIITFNGTIYNYLGLRENLIKYGVIFSTLSDTEVIVECYKKWGTKAFEMLDGAYAFAIIDKHLNQLLIARDNLGTKPLYFFKQKGLLVFSSEIRGLLNYPSLAKEVNKNALASYFRYGYFVGEETIYKDIYKFKKGNLTTIDLHSGNSYESSLTKFQFKVAATSEESEDVIVAKIEEFLTASILKRNVANVPIGVLLSGGYDSATVASILQNNQTKRIKTYTVGFENKKLDEAPIAKKIAAQLNTNHSEFYLDGLKIAELVKSLPEIFDEPLGDSTTIPMIFLARELKDEVRVLLGSEGGDELFGGCRIYGKALKIDAFANNSFPNWIKNISINLIKRLRPRMDEVFEADNLLDKYLAVNACFTKSALSRLLNTSVDFRADDRENVLDIKGLLTYDLNTYLPNSILLKNERSFNYFGIDNRDALLKNDLVEYLSTLPNELFIKENEQKYLLKQITHKYIPEYLLTEPKKVFAVPLKSWLNSGLKPLVDFYLSEAKLKEHDIINSVEVARIRSAFKLNATAYNAQKIWLILQFQMWYEKWMK